MHADWQPGLFGRLVDRPIAALADRLDGAAEQQHLDEIFVTRAIADFGRCRWPVFIGNDDRALQAAVLAGPFIDLPIVDGRTERSRELVIADALACREWIEHAEHDIVRIEMLLLHEGERRA